MDKVQCLMFCFLVFHFLIYIVFLKKYISSEKAIIGYHFFSAVVVAVCSFVLYVNTGYLLSQISVKMSIILGIHGVYSLTFLEIWSLTQGSYALTILSKLYNANANHGVTDFSALEQVGAAKQGNRIQHLISLGLIKVSGEKMRLTSLGHMIACFSNGVSYLANTKMRE